LYHATKPHIPKYEVLYTRMYEKSWTCHVVGCYL